jgi:chromate reductase
MKTKTINVCIISGSSREDNLTFRVAKAIQNILLKNPEIHQTFLLDLRENDFPMVGRKDIHPNSLTNYQKNFIQSMENAHLIFICMPEYNWTTNPELINIFHQIGNKNFKSCFENKVFATAGISHGRGGRKPCIDFHTLLNKLISFMDAYGIVSPLIFEGHESDKNIDNQGNLLNNEIFNKTLIRFIQYSLNLTKKWNGF